MGGAGVAGRGVRGLAPGAVHVLFEEGAWGPTHAISKKELFAWRPPAAAAVTPRPTRFRRRRIPGRLPRPR